MYNFIRNSTHYVTFLYFQAREKRLQQQIASLQQLVDSLRVELAEKTQTNIDLDVQLKLLVSSSHICYYIAVFAKMQFFKILVI